MTPNSMDSSFFSHFFVACLRWSTNKHALSTLDAAIKTTASLVHFMHASYSFDLGTRVKSLCIMYLFTDD